MAEWCRGIDAPVIFDIGANSGFISTQLAQLLAPEHPRIFAFEPVPSTFAQLRLSVARLGLADSVSPICGAVSDREGIATLIYSDRQSLMAQIKVGGENARVGTLSTHSATVTLDGVVASLSLHPALLKVDVEGFEAHVLRGARTLLQGAAPPAVCFEWNPLTMSEVGESPDEIIEMLMSHALYYVDDFEGQRFPFGTPVTSPREVDWVCNLFAVPKNEEADTRWRTTLASASALLSSQPKT